MSLNAPIDDATMENLPMLFDFQNEFAYIFYTLAVIFGFVLAFAVGANDSANSWGTPIGAGSISLRMAFLLGFVFETLGALFLSR